MVFLKEERESKINNSSKNKSIISDIPEKPKM